MVSDTTTLLLLLLSVQSRQLSASCHRERNAGALGLLTAETCPGFTLLVIGSHVLTEAQSLFSESIISIRVCRKCSVGASRLKGGRYL